MAWIWPASTSHSTNHADWVRISLTEYLIPGRAGDIATIAMLHKKCAVPVGTATFAVGMVGFFEGAIFGLMMVLVLLMNAPMWIHLGEETHLQSLQTISGLTLLGIAIVIVAAIIGRRFTDEPDNREEFSPLTWIKDAFSQTQSNLTDIRYIFSIVLLQLPRFGS